MKKLKEVLENKINGLYYGNRVLLPFAAEVLKVVIKDNIITDFNSEKSGVKYSVKEKYTEFYFTKYDDLRSEIRDFEVIKLVLVEQGEDIFNFKNHLRIDIHPEEKHVMAIEKVDDEMLFFE